MEAIDQAVAALREAEALVIAAGAGMGVDSGLADFRGNDGFWRAYPPFKKLGLSFMQLAQPRWFHDDPEMAWGFYGHRRNLYRATTPHAGFATLLAWGRRMTAGYFVFTSNVDGHFHKAGFPDDRVVECHGSLEWEQCLRFCSTDIVAASENVVGIDETTFRATKPLSTCPKCGDLSRPNVLLFNDDEWLPQRTESQIRRLERWLTSVASRRLVVIEFGAGLSVPTVRRTSESLGGQLIRVNPREPSTPSGGISLPMGARDAIEQMERLWQCEVG